MKCLVKILFLVVFDDKMCFQNFNLAFLKRKHLSHSANSFPCLESLGILHLEVYHVLKPIHTFMLTTLIGLTTKTLWPEILVG